MPSSSLAQAQAQHCLSQAQFCQHNEHEKDGRNIIFPFELILFLPLEFPIA